MKIKSSFSFLIITLLVCSNPLAQEEGIIGTIDTITKINAKTYIRGWSCAIGSSDLLNVELYIGDKRSSGGLKIAAAKASLIQNSSKVTERCKSQAKGHHFRILLKDKVIEKYSDLPLYIYAYEVINSKKKYKLISNPKEIKVPSYANYDFTCEARVKNRCNDPKATRINTKSIAQRGGGDLTTHYLKSGGATLGISNKGGGYINYLSLKRGGPDIVSKVSSKFGRGAQPTVRDELHGKKYNPTLAGFHDNAGSVVKILGDKVSKTMLILPPRRLAAFKGDSEYDFTEKTNLVDDRYAGSGDWDKLDEPFVTQEKEIETDFDSYGYYQNCLNQKSSPSGEVVFRIPCFKFYYEFRFVRDGHFLTQFLHGGVKSDGKSILKDGRDGSKPEDNFLDGKAINKQYDVTRKDMGTFISRFTFRFDNSVWDPQYRFIMTGNEKLSPIDRTKKYVEALHTSTNEHIIILAKTNDPNMPGALALFKPKSQVNSHSILTRRNNGTSVGRAEKRVLESTISDNPSRLNRATVPREENMSLFGFGTTYTGLVNPSNLGNESILNFGKKKYELVRSEYYILVGSPNQIRNQVKRYNKLILSK